MDDTPPFPSMAKPANEPTEAELLALLTRLRKEHRAIDHEIDDLREMGVLDVLKVKRMKKIKLAMKDRISFIENQLTPDIIA